MKQDAESSLFRAVRDALTRDRVETRGVHLVFGGRDDARQAHALGVENLENGVHLRKRLGVRHEKQERWVSSSVRQEHVRTRGTELNARQTVRRLDGASAQDLSKLVSVDGIRSQLAHVLDVLSRRFGFTRLTRRDVPSARGKVRAHLAAEHRLRKHELQLLERLNLRLAVAVQTRLKFP